MKKILLILVMSMFLISLVSSEISSSSGECSIGSVKQGDTIQLTQVCRGGCTDVNLTKVMFPNQSVALLGQFPMGENGSNYNFTFSNTDTLGNYNYDVEGVDPNSIVVGQSCSFKVTPTGNDLDNPQSIIVVGLIFVLILLTGSFLYFGKEVEYVPFKIFLISMGSLLLMFTVGVSVNTITELMIIGSVFAATFVNLYRLMLILISAGGIGLMLYIVYMSVKQFYSYRGLMDEYDD